MSLTGKSRRFSSSAKEVPSTLDRHRSIVRDDIHVILEVVFLEHRFLLFLRLHPEHECAPELVSNNGEVEGHHCLNSAAHVEDVVQACEGEDDRDEVVLRVGLGVEEFRFAADQMEQRVRETETHSHNDKQKATHVTTSWEVSLWDYCISGVSSGPDRLGILGASQPCQSLYTSSFPAAGSWFFALLCVLWSVLHAGV